MAAIKEPISQNMPPSVVTLLKTLRGSFLLFVAAIGICCILFGLFLEFVLGEGVLAGMFGVWGFSAMLAAGAAYAVLLYLQ
ncbi:hypothetical protein SAMN05421858_3589 [Haladaptatus litoreus]|uniref:Uncharacterized protein n=1 Tax=Haladaptatus litoreus TaxID=553468 RepID=A0A1N7DG25_9EURY|nr:hypothetical protein [Haladaptatus litoreus]SIR74717.1 hypothetical protein SAMN05421858_3589 [Haladaptatus litoreus]